MGQPLPIFLAPTPKTSSFLLSPSIVVSFFQGYGRPDAAKVRLFFWGGGKEIKSGNLRGKRESQRERAPTRSNDGGIRRSFPEEEEDGGDHGYIFLWRCKENPSPPPSSTARNEFLSFPPMPTTQPRTTPYRVPLSVS